MAQSSLYLTVILPTLVASIVTGLFGSVLGRRLSHSIAILGILIATIAAYFVFYQVHCEGVLYNGPLYTWLSTGQGFTFTMGILIDRLTALMLVVVTTISLMVHIYSIGYMAGEYGYQRFFSYISLFTFMMIILVTSNNFVQLFFGWEGVGLVSYLLIGFYFKKSSANSASLKAFLINRVSDFGFILAIGLIFAYFGTLNYSEVISQVSKYIDVNLYGSNWNIITVICILLFIGAMGKSAQFPLHIWLADSMEGPTPISALIHAATMVTAGIFMVARLSPIFNESLVALSVMIFCGGINCFFIGAMGIIQNDIKRVIAYSTLSQLGYMVVALGCGAYSIGIFHLMTHAFFKALLFLAAGSVIIAMHHEQNMQKMGGLAKYMPFTYFTMLVGALALVGIPPFSGFFSKDMILESAHLAYKHGLPMAGFAVFITYASIFITALYTFRMIFMTFHGKERFHKNDSNLSTNLQPKESPLVIILPLAILAIPSLLIGYFSFNGFVSNSLLNESVFNAKWYIDYVNSIYISPIKMMLDNLISLPVCLSITGIIVAWLFHRFQNMSEKFINIIRPLYILVEKGYFIDYLFLNIFAPLGRGFGKLFWYIGDILLIDGLLVNGAGKVINWYSIVLKRIQSGYINSYATFMVVGVILLLTFCSKLIFS